MSRHMEKEGYSEAPGVEILKASIRKSTRLEIQNKPSSCSQPISKSLKNTSKYTMKSSKRRLHEISPISDSKHQFSHKIEKNVVISADTASMKSSTIVPSFNYHIGAKEGIRLIVDLNLKRSDWLKSLEKTVCVCQNHLKPEFESFKQEVECLGGRNNHKSNSPDKTTVSDSSTNSYVQNKVSIKSSIQEIEKTLPSMAEKSCSKIGKMYFDDGSKRKKHDQKSGQMTQIHGQSHERRILRSTKVFGGQIFESGGVVVRRSSRLHLK